MFGGFPVSSSSPRSPQSLWQMPEHRGKPNTIQKLPLTGQQEASARCSNQIAVAYFWGQGEEVAKKRGAERRARLARLAEVCLYRTAYQ